MTLPLGCLCKNVSMEPTLEDHRPDYLTGTCGNCAKDVRFRPRMLLAQVNGQTYGDQDAAFESLECPSCGLGTVANPAPGIERMWSGINSSGRRQSDFILSPGELPGRIVPGLPSDIASAWQEALSAGQVKAWTAAELMCRKILMHLAVDLCGASEGKSFVVYVAALNDAHYFPPKLQPIVDGIRERGNRATHDLASSTEQDARRTIKVTEHVLASIYELPNI